MRTRVALALVTLALVLTLAGMARAEVFFDLAFGTDVDPAGGSGLETCTTATGCQAGEAGADAGAMNFLSGIAIDAQGRILVVEFLNRRVSRFVVATDGTVSFDRAFGVGVQTGAAVFENCTAATGCLAGLADPGAGGLQAPAHVAVDAEGRILVAGGFNRVSRFVVAGDGTVSFDRAFGVGVATGATAFENCTTASGCQSGVADGQAGGLSGPSSVAIDAQGRILVTDVGNFRVSRFTVAGDGTVSFDRAFGVGVDTGATVFENCTAASGCQAGLNNAGAGGFFLAQGIGVDTQGRVLVADRLRRRVSVFTVAGDGTVSFDRAFGVGVDTGAAIFENCTAASGCQNGVSSAAAGAVGTAFGVASDRQGRVLVADGANARVSRFVVAGDGTVSFDRAFSTGVDTGAADVFENCTTASGCQAGTLSEAAGAISGPVAVTVDGRGRIVVADSGNNRVSRFTMYGVTYDGNGATGGTVPVDDLTYETGDPVTVAANVGGLVRTGHTFFGWNTQANGGGTSYNASGSDTFAMGTADVVLFARWVLNGPFTVSFDENGGSVVPNQIVPLGGTATEPAPPPTRGGHAFGGWFVDPALTTPFDFATPITSDRVLFARWTFVGGPDLAIVKTHAGGFLRDQFGTYQITITNVGDAPTVGAVTVTEVLPAGLFVSAIAGTGWTCDSGALTCTRADVLGPGASYPSILVVVSVTVSAPLLVVNEATVAGGGDANPANNTAFDPTAILPPDVMGYPFLPWITALIEAGITKGCGLLYCPDVPVTRAQMAVFLLRGMLGAGFEPPAPTGLFTDVPVTGTPHPFAAWIEELFRRGITGGCGPNVYCPDVPVTRAQMAVFLLRAVLGAGFEPPGPIGLFTDVPVTGDPGTTHPFAAWIEELFRRGITSGCGTGLYCPDATVTRGQMAVFLARAFGLLL